LILKFFNTLSTLPNTVHGYLACESISGMAKEFERLSYQTITLDLGGNGRDYEKVFHH
jgi:hypothetical protein